MIPNKPRPLKTRLDPKGIGSGQCKVNITDKMNPKLLILALAWVSQLPLPKQSEALDFVTLLYSLCFWFAVVFGVSGGAGQTVRFVSPKNIPVAYHAQKTSSKVEVFSGDRQLSKALENCGYRGKSFDATWLYCMVPQNKYPCKQK